ncbi:MAG: hypothetical protein EXX96DRAFT_102957 [Benjaminiella poitrasii]|nr:MAG: hypothetical protein EXX96DRAFT_102957 [Benjaminiella poitrasii]
MPIPSYKKPNQTRIAAVSNYKLAQLTFAPPDSCTLRKTALIKNLVDIIYRHTPREYLLKMTRWQYFTPESLEDVTQKDIEKVIYRYSQIIFNTANVLEKRLREQRFLISDYPEQEFKEETKSNQHEQQQQQSEDLLEASFYATLFSHPNSVFSNESLDSLDSHVNEEVKEHSTNTKNKFKDNDDNTSSLISTDNHLQNQPNTNIEYSSSPPKKISGVFNNNNIASNNDANNNSSNITNRLSWLSDTGVPTSSTVATNLASELMTLFDMEFNVDLNLPDLKRLENNNGSSTSLHKVFSADQSDSDPDDDEEEHTINDGNYFEKTTNYRHPITTSKTLPPIKTFSHISNIPNKLFKKQSNSNNLSLQQNNSPFIPAPHISDTTSSARSGCEVVYASSHNIEEDKEGASTMNKTLNGLDNAFKRVIPPNRSTSLEYRNSLQDRFELSDDEMSQTSSSYFNDSLDTFELEAYVQSQENTSINEVPTFKGFLHALSSIKKVKNNQSSNSSIHQEPSIVRESENRYGDSHSTIQSTGFHSVSTPPTPESLHHRNPSGDFDLDSVRTHKRKNSLQKFMDFVKGEPNERTRRNSAVSGIQIETTTPATTTTTTASSYSILSPSSTVRSSKASLFSDDINKQHIRNTPPSSPITLTPRATAIKYRNAYSTSIVSDISSFNWADEVYQHSPTEVESGSIRSKASNMSNRTLPSFFSHKGNNHNGEGIRLPQRSKSSSAMGFIKRLTSFNKKDKRPIRA